MTTNLETSLETSLFLNTNYDSNWVAKRNFLKTKKNITMGTTYSRTIPQTYACWGHPTTMMCEQSHQYATFEHVSIDFIRITESAKRTYEFRVLLWQLDQFSHRPGRVQWLEFWLASRTLEVLNRVGDRKGARKHLRKMKRDFFNGRNQIDLLSGDEIYEACKTICACGLVELTGPISIAQRNVGRKLDELRRNSFFDSPKDVATQTRTSYLRFNRSASMK